MDRPISRLFSELGMVVHKVPRHAGSKTIEVEGRKITFLHAALNIAGGRLNTFFHATEECLSDLIGKTCVFKMQVMYKLCDGDRKFYHIDYHHVSNPSAEDVAKARRVVVTNRTLSELESGSDEWDFIPIPAPLSGTIVVMPQDEKLAVVQAPQQAEVKKSAAVTNEVVKPRDVTTVSHRRVSSTSQKHSAVVHSLKVDSSVVESIALAAGFKMKVRK